MFRKWKNRILITLKRSSAMPFSKPFSSHHYLTRRKFFVSYPTTTCFLFQSLRNLINATISWRCLVTVTFAFILIGISGQIVTQIRSPIPLPQSALAVPTSDREAKKFAGFIFLVVFIFFVSFLSFVRWGSHALRKANKRTIL